MSSVILVISVIGLLIDPTNILSHLIGWGIYVLMAIVLMLIPSVIKDKESGCELSELEITIWEMLSQLQNKQMLSVGKLLDILLEISFIVLLLFNGYVTLPLLIVTTLTLANLCKDSWISKVKEINSK